ncbi:MAG: phosphotransferase [Kistimonas sp.]|nr:phosphotransferase [Kistimonas sp.]
MTFPIERAAVRMTELESWLHEQLARATGQKSNFQRRSLPADASHRRYFRLHTDQGQRFIAVDWPPEYGDCGAFAAIGSSWREQGVYTPAIYAVDSLRGFMLLEDLGAKLLYESLAEQALSWNTSAARRAHFEPYGKALGVLQTIQGLREAESYRRPLYDRSILHREISLFTQWCAAGLLQLKVPAPVQSLLDAFFDQAIASALEQPQVPVHRDFHSRNLLLPGAADELGVIDFQDTVTGPVTYDIVSLLRDSYLDWPQGLVYQWLDGFAAHSPHLQGVSSAQLHRWFDWMGLQRHFKVLGIFSRLHVRDNRSEYLQYLPRTFAYIQHVCRVYPELDDLHGWLESVLLPCFEQQPWWCDFSLHNTISSLRGDLL